MRYQADYGILLWITDFWCVCVYVCREEIDQKDTEAWVMYLADCFIFMDYWLVEYVFIEDTELWVRYLADCGIFLWITD